MNGFYENTGFVNKRNRKQILILDVDDSKAGDTHLGAGTEFNIELFEPLIIDSLSEVYLDNFISFNSNISNDDDNSAFVLKINEFNINSNVASSNDKNFIFNSLLIPNEHSNVANNQSMVIQKAKKFNYVCDVNPRKISSISGKITNLKGGPMFHGSSTSAIYTYALTGIDSGNITGGTGLFPIEVGAQIISITGGGASSSSISGTFLATHFSTSTTLHFSSNSEITITKGGNTTNIIFTMSNPSVTYQISNGSSLNLNLLLITNPGRFIAEFSINSRE
jgi:hypothetical protein